MLTNEQFDNLLDILELIVDIETHDDTEFVGEDIG